MDLIAAVLVVAVMLLLSLVVAPKGWRTMVFNALSAIPPLAASVGAVLTGFDWTTVLSSKGAALAGLAVLVGNAILRSITTTPMGTK